MGLLIVALKLKRGDSPIAEFELRLCPAMTLTESSRPADSAPSPLQLA
jgi:hypothetical protein